MLASLSSLSDCENIQKTDPRDTFGNSSIHYSAEDGNVDMLDALLKQAIDINAQVCRLLAAGSVFGNSEFATSIKFGHLKFGFDNLVE